MRPIPILTPVQKVVVMHLRSNQKKKKARENEANLSLFSSQRDLSPKEGSLTLKGGLYIE